MMVLVSYDVSTLDAAGRRRLRRVARLCRKSWPAGAEFGYSNVLWMQPKWVVLRASLVSEPILRKDSLRFYFLGNEWKRRSSTLAPR